MNVVLRVGFINILGLNKGEATDTKDRHIQGGKNCSPKQKPKRKEWENCHINAFYLSEGNLKYSGNKKTYAI